MSSPSTLFTGLSGLSANNRRLETIGNNIANVNTNAFKSNRVLFAPNLSRNFSLGSSPNALNGGTNPAQIGAGVRVSATQRNFAGGATTPTGIPTDLAIEGNGFFIVDREGQRFFTRDGAFQLNANNELVTPSGARVQGFTVDSEFNLIEGNLSDMTIPVGVATLAEATSNVNFSGNLNAAGDVATQGSVHTLEPFTTGGGTPATGATLLTALDAPTLAVGDVFRIRDAQIGDKTIPEASLTITATTDVDELMVFIGDALGIVDGAAAGGTGGVTIDAAGVVSIAGNLGTANDLAFDNGEFGFVDSTGANIDLFVPERTQSADGESVRSTFVVYDTLGTPVNVDVTAVFESTETDGGTNWRLYFRSPDDSDAAYNLDLAGLDNAPLIRFNESGQLIDDAPVPIQINRVGTGAADPIGIALNFNSVGDNVTAFSSPSGANGLSSLAATFQDGSPLGVLSSFAVGVDGTIVGGFTNGLTRTIGRVAVGSFTNPEGLVDVGENLFAVGPNSGTALITGPTEFGTGRIIGGALELSNVDLPGEFINLITTQTGYSASSRVITSADELLQQLLATVG
ncbi:MAG: flagellar hook-basal body complex protein [Planctomycetota bacterium]